ncbi:hypothetical protein [Flavobacterium soyae]|uniref:hypothetical protein n=1 Tax=Flavobacterium soyae TaxID=2903098 RepID=UPI001E62800D|nr:hypothetical protein [Flavobacterium soyae]MCD9575458.1 hypothetical protein [Flavobacterium soyae]
MCSRAGRSRQLGENVYLSVDIVLYNKNGKRISGMVQEIDGLLIKNNNEIDKIISMKLDVDYHRFKKDNIKLTQIIRDLPDDGLELKNYIINNDHLKKLSNTIKNDAVEAKILYIDLRSGKEIIESPTVFRSKIKASYDPVSDFQKIHPETFNTTKDILIESSYQSIKNKF